MSDKAVDITEEESSALRRPENIVDKIITFISGADIFITSVVLVVLISVATFVRYILQADLYGYDEWAKLLAIWLYFFGAAYGAYNESHVSADLVVAFLKDGAFRRLVLVVKDIISLCVCLLFMYYGWDYFYFSLTGPLGTGVAIPTTSVWRLPMWTYNLAIFLCLAIMAFYLLKYALRDLFSFFRALKGDVKR